MPGVVDDEHEPQRVLLAEVGAQPGDDPGRADHVGELGELFRRRSLLQRLHVLGQQDAAGLQLVVPQVRNRDPLAQNSDRWNDRLFDDLSRGRVEGPLYRRIAVEAVADGDVEVVVAAFGLQVAGDAHTVARALVGPDIEAVLEVQVRRVGARFSHGHVDDHVVLDVVVLVAHRRRIDQQRERDVGGVVGPLEKAGQPSDRAFGGSARPLAGLVDRCGQREQLGVLPVFEVLRAGRRRQQHRRDASGHGPRARTQVFHGS